MLEERRVMLAEKQLIEKDKEKLKKVEQTVILNKGNARPKLAFSLGSK